MKWISVKKRMPSDEERVLILDSDQRVLVGRYLINMAQWIDDTCCYWYFDTATHWMPLPQSPKEQE